MTQRDGLFGLVFFPGSLRWNGRIDCFHRFGIHTLSMLVIYCVLKSNYRIFGCDIGVTGSKGATSGADDSI